ncbi:hypothetical protein EON65_57010 [archaeon]|nr:MAG: hypothetical protein EON65_57010 [archaeon]
MSTDLDIQGAELIESLRKEFPSLTIEFKNSAICVRMLGFWAGIAGKSVDNNWVVNEEVKSVVRNYVVFKKLESELLQQNPSCRGAYLLVNSPTSRFVYETHDSASRDKEPHGFLGRIGIEDSSEEVLALAGVEKPDNFDNLHAR